MKNTGNLGFFWTINVNSPTGLRNVEVIESFIYNTNGYQIVARQKLVISSRGCLSIKKKQKHP